MGKFVSSAAYLALLPLAASGVLAQAAAPNTSDAKPAATQASAKPAQEIDRTILHVQVILDHLGFSPGVLDGQEGLSLTQALSGFQTSRGLPVTGKIDRTTLRALYPYRAWRPTVTLSLSERALAGPYVKSIPDDPADQAKLETMGYADPLEKLGEMFHTTPDTLKALNGGAPNLQPGAAMVFPNALPTSRDYPGDLDAKWRTTLNQLNVDATEPQADHVVVDKSEGVLKVYDASNRLIAQFGATMGSSHDPLPIGTWKIQAKAYNPPFHYNPDLFWDADAGDKKETLPPGPNGPVGVAWLDLSKEHYGIHGTSAPETIGRAQSHGCIRLTNWNVARLALMVKPGTPAIFQE